MNDFVGPQIPLNSTIGISDNSSFLVHTHTPTFQEPLSGSTLGILMVLSVFQYDNSINPTYSNAISQASKAAYIQSGGQAFQDKITSKAEGTARNVMHSVGITDGQVGTLLGITKVVKDRSLSLDGPKVHSVSTHLTLSQTNGSIGLEWTFK